MEQREIKFRAWDGTTMHSSSEDDYDFYVASDGSIKYLESVDYQGDIRTYRAGWTLMQYTGLKDKNGREIYEGDIITSLYSFEGCKGVYEVVWNEGAFRPKRHGVHQQTGVTISMYDLTRCEVIGDIYQNPELLSV